MSTAKAKILFQKAALLGSNNLANNTTNNINGNDDWAHVEEMKQSWCYFMRQAVSNKNNYYFFS